MSVRGDGDRGLCEVRLIGVPLRLRQRTLEHADEVMREVQLLERDDASDSGDAVADDGVIARITSLRNRFSPEYNEMAATVRRLLDDAEAADEPSADVSYHVSRDVIGVIMDMQLLLDELDAYCRAGDLLTLASPPDCIAYRRWVLSQHVEQLAGRPPTSWPDWSLAHTP